MRPRLRQPPSSSSSQIPPRRASRRARCFAEVQKSATTIAELSGGKLPAGVVLDGHSIAPQLRSEPGTQREWIYNQLAAMWYVREAGGKLNEKGELFDMSGAPFTEKLVIAADDTDASKTARARLAAVLAKLNPAGGIPDSGDGTGRHANKDKKKVKAKSEPSAAPAPPRPRPHQIPERQAPYPRPAWGCRCLSAISSAVSASRMGRVV